MEWLGIDTTSARLLGRHLVGRAAVSDDLGAQARRLSAGLQLDLGPWRRFDELGEQLRDLARVVAHAIGIVESHVMHLAPAPDVALNDAGQLGSHNTYRSDRPVHELYDGGIRSFEFDVQEPNRAGEWPIYHHRFDAETNVGSLHEALASIARLPDDDVLTVVLDLKNAPATRLDRNNFDQAIRSAFGDRLFTPLDFIARAPGQVTVGSAAAQAGWPTFEQMSGRVIVIVTGDVASYRQRSALVAAAFVAAKPTNEAIVDPHIVVYNAPSTGITADEVIALQELGGLVRTWGVPTDAGRLANYLAIDV